MQSPPVDPDVLHAALPNVAAAWVREQDLQQLEARPGEVVMALPATPKNVHQGGVPCARALMAAADTAMVQAIVTRLGECKPMTTVQLQTGFLRAIAGDTGPARVVAGVLRMGRRLVFGAVEACDGQGQLAAHGTTTCALP
jgi:acyl-coenzyme A thioesterase PaaI-like protein